MHLSPQNLTLIPVKPSDFNKVKYSRSYELKFEKVKGTLFFTLNSEFPQVATWAQYLQIESSYHWKAEKICFPMI